MPNAGWNWESPPLPPAPLTWWGGIKHFHPAPSTWAHGLCEHGYRPQQKGDCNWRQAAVHWLRRVGAPSVLSFWTAVGMRAPGKAKLSKAFPFPWSEAHSPCSVLSSPTWVCDAHSLRVKAEACPQRMWNETGLPYSVSSAKSMDAVQVGHGKPGFCRNPFCNPLAVVPAAQGQSDHIGKYLSNSQSTRDTDGWRHPAAGRPMNLKLEWLFFPVSYNSAPDISSFLNLLRKNLAPSVLASTRSCPPLGS